MRFVDLIKSPLTMTPPLYSVQQFGRVAKPFLHYLLTLHSTRFLAPRHNKAHHIRLAMW